MIKIQVINDSVFQEEILSQGEINKKQVVEKLAQFPTKLRIIFLEKK